jgi:hypothetical protein
MAKHPVGAGTTFKILRRSGGWGLEVLHTEEGPAFSGVMQLTSFNQIVAFIKEHYEVDEPQGS